MILGWNGVRVVGFFGECPLSPMRSHVVCELPRLFGGSVDTCRRFSLLHKRRRAILKIHRVHRAQAWRRRQILVEVPLPPGPREVRSFKLRSIESKVASWDATAIATSAHREWVETATDANHFEF